jgi:thioredoxin 1
VIEILLQKKEHSVATIDITADTFQDIITENDIVIIDFWADWCGPCKSFAPTYEAVSEKHEDIVFGKVDTEAQQELGAHFQIRSIPTLMIFREQVVLFSEAGALGSSKLNDLIAKVRDLDMKEVHAKIEEQAK